MRKYAFLQNNIVVKVELMSDESYVEQSRIYQLIVDVDGQFPVPEVGWVLNGNVLVSNSGEYTPEQLDRIQQHKQREFGAKLAIDLVDMMGAKNLTLTRQGISVDVSSLLVQLNAIKTLLETGAIKTSKSLIMYIYNSFPTYQSILDHALLEINIFLTNNGY
jgi:two-component sensor histidine kinase